MSDSPELGDDGGKSLSQKMAEATICTIISLDICLTGMVARVDLTCSLTVRMKCSISGTCYFLDAQFRSMPIEVISLSSGSNSQLVYIFVILKPLCRYNLCTHVITSAMFSIFRFLVILPVENMMCRNMVLRKLIPLM